MMMTTDFITPIQRMTTIDEAKQAAVAQPDKAQGYELFSSIFEQAANDIKVTQAEVEQQQYLLATGQLEDPHNLTIATSQAQLTVDMMVQIRNHAVEAYNELLRINF